jgi:hypothetical protein
MPTTSRGYPYPGLTDAPNVPADIQALAVALNNDLARLNGLSSKVATPVGPLTSLTSLVTAAPVTGDGVKRFKITGSFYSIVGTVAGDVFEARLYDGSLSTLLGMQRVLIPASPFQTAGVTVVTTNVPAAGSHLYQMYLARVTGTGTATVSGGNTFPIEIIVEQIA